MFSWFNKKENDRSAPNFDFPFEKIEQINGGQKNRIYTDMWKNADKSQGFPVFVLWDDVTADMLEENEYSYEETDIEDYIAERLEEERSNAEADGYSLDDLLGQPDDTDEGLFEFSSFEIYGDGYDLILAHVPVENPWQIFEKIPFGSYNECPEPSVIAAFAKMAYEKFGAVPAVISADTLEFAVERKPSKEEALALAWKIFALCPDMVTQDHSIYSFADLLSKSDVWFFWWD